MFSLVWSYIQASFRRPKIIAYESGKLEVDQQILQELAVAAEIGMVSTRSQEPGLVVDFEQKPSKGTPGLRNAKRKSPSESHSDDHGSRPHKRYKEATPDRQVPFINGNSKPFIPVVSPTKNLNIPNDGIEVRIAKASEHDASERRLSSSQKNTPPEPPSQQDDVHTTRETSESVVKRHAKARLPFATHPSEPLEQTNEKAKSQFTGNPKHQRVGSQDPPERPLLALENSTGPAVASKLPIDTQTDAESEDEAPETISASTGRDQARSAASEAAKVAEAQKAIEKQKRRDRDARLKLQAKSTKVHNQLPAKLTPEFDTLTSPSTLIGSSNGPNRDNEVKTKRPDKPQLPDLLPEDILNAEPLRHVPTTPLKEPAQEQRLSKKRKLLDKDTKPPRDVQRGNLTVRVLHSASENMAPRISKESRWLRESWLTGQRGPKGGIERRKPSGGFIRRK